MRRRAVAAPALGLALLAAACHSSPPEGADPQGRRSLVDGTGRQVVLPPRAERIVSLAPDLTQTLFAIGAGPAVVGVSDQCDRPAAELSGLARVGSLVEPSIERILVLRPDLVLASADGNPLTTLERLRALGAPVYGVKPVATGLEGVVEQVLAVAAASGREAGATAAVARFEAQLDEARANAAGRPRLRACWLVWEDPPTAAGAGTFLDALLDLASLENACARGDEAWPRLSREELLVAAPEALISSSGAHGDRVAALSGWGAPLPALKNGRVLSVDADRYQRQALELGPAAIALVERTTGWWPGP